MPQDSLRSVGKCQITGKLGEGGMGVVYRGRHTDLDIDVAIKVLVPQLAGRADMTGRFVREARLAARVDHSGVVRVLDCGQQGDLYYMVMEFIDGRSLQDLVEVKGFIDLHVALEVVRSVAEALGAAQKQVGIIHRDIKPDNIMITREGRIKVADLGLAKIVADEQGSGIDGHTATGVAMGTPHFMSPEQCTDAKSVDHRADIFSLGASLYYIVSGMQPFEGDTVFSIMRNVVESDPRPLPDSVPPEVRALIFRMMAKKPEDRFATYDDLVAEVDRVRAALGLPQNARMSLTADVTALVLRSVEAGTRTVPELVSPSQVVANRTATFYDAPDVSSAPPSGEAITKPPTVAGSPTAHTVATKGRSSAWLVLLFLLVAGAVAGGTLYYLGVFEPIDRSGDLADEGEAPEKQLIAADEATGPMDSEAGAASSSTMTEPKPGASAKGEPLVFGRIAATEGAVESKHGAEDWKTVAEGGAVRDGDALRTGESRVRIALETGSAIFLDRYSEIACAFDKGRPPGITLVSGAAYIETVMADKGFVVETPSGRVVDFGTRFLVEIKGDGIVVEVLEGKVEASTAAGRTELGEGQRVVLRSREAAPGEVEAASQTADSVAWAVGLRRLEKDMASRRAEVDRALIARDAEAYDALERRVQGFLGNEEYAAANSAVEAVMQNFGSEGYRGKAEALLGRISAAELASRRRAEEARLERSMGAYAALVEQVRAFKAKGEFAAARAAIGAFRTTADFEAVEPRIDDLLAELSDAESMRQRSDDERRAAEEARLARQEEAFAKLAVQVGPMKERGEFVAALIALDAFKQTAESAELAARIEALAADVRMSQEARQRAEAREREAFDRLSGRAMTMAAAGETAAALAAVEAFRDTVESATVRAAIDGLAAELKMRAAAASPEPAKQVEANPEDKILQKARDETAKVDPVAGGDADVVAGGAKTADDAGGAKASDEAKQDVEAEKVVDTAVTAAPVDHFKDGFIVLSGHSGWVRSVAFAPDGRHVATVGTDKSVRLWNAADGKLVRTFGLHGAEVNAVAFSADGGRLASASSDKTVAIWNVDGGRRERTLTFHTNRVFAVGFSSDGGLVASGGLDELAIVANASTGQRVTTCRPKQHFVNAIAWSPDGRILATGLARRAGAGHFGGAVLWNPATGDGLARLAQDNGFVTCVAFSPNGRLLAAGDLNLKKVVVWDVASRQVEREIGGMTSGVWSVAFSPDGRMIVAACDDGTIGLHEAATGRRLRTLQGHRGPALSVAFSGDGKYVVSGSQDGSARIWRLED